MRLVREEQQKRETGPHGVAFPEIRCTLAEGSYRPILVALLVRDGACDEARLDLRFRHALHGFEHGEGREAQRRHVGRHGFSTRRRVERADVGVED